MTATSMKSIDHHKTAAMDALVSLTPTSIGNFQTELTPSDKKNAAKSIQEKSTDPL